MRVTWAGTHDPTFSRNRKLARLLELAGVEVTVVRESLWETDRLALVGRRDPRIVLRASVRYIRLVARLAKSPRPDLYLVSYPGWFDVPVVRLVAWAKRRRVVFDPFISLFDTVVGDRRLVEARSALGRIARLADRLSLHLADYVLADTGANLRLYDDISPGVLEKASVLPLGADDSVFVPSHPRHAPGRTVLFHGTFVPLQGVGTVADAGRLLARHGIKTVLVGDGQDRPAVEMALRGSESAAVELTGILPLGSLPEKIEAAGVCLGIFGTSDKAGRVVPHKVFECLAMRRAVVTRDSEAVRSLFQEGELVVVPPGDPASLAEAVRALLDDPARREAVASAGHAAYMLRFHEGPLSQQLGAALQVAARGTPPNTRSPLPPNYTAVVRRRRSARVDRHHPHPGRP